MTTLGQNSEAATERARLAGYIQPNQRDGCLICKHSEPKLYGDLSCDLHRIYVKNLGICPSFTGTMKKAPAA